LAALPGPRWKAWGDPTISRAAWIPAILVLFGIVAVLCHVSSTTMEYSRYNPEWNGTSRLFQEMIERDAMMVSGFHELPGGGDALLLILAPGESYAPDEIGLLRTFLEEGNIVVLVSDKERENLLISGLGSSIRIRDGNLTSIDRFFDHPSSVLAFPAGQDPLGAGISRIVLNNPSSLEGGEPVFTSSLLSWIDADGDSRLGRDETLQRFSVIAADRVGEGVLYVIADPSIFINGMDAIGMDNENYALARQIMSARPRFIVEQGRSRTAYAPEAIRVVNLVKDSTITKMAVITLIFLVGSIFVIGRWKEA